MVVEWRAGLAGVEWRAGELTSCLELPTGLVFLPDPHHPSPSLSTRTQDGQEERARCGVKVRGPAADEEGFRRA